MNKLRIPEEIDQVPDYKGGIYSFSLRFPTDYELGLKSKIINCRRVALNIKNKLVELDEILNSNTMSGDVNNPLQSQHISRMYKVVFDEIKTPIQSELIDSVETKKWNVEELTIVANALRQAFLYASPIYVGMTRKQSLKTRLTQHMSGDSQFSQRLKEKKLSWRDLYYHYIALDDFYIEMSADLEKLVQSIFKPSLSMR